MMNPRFLPAFSTALLLACVFPAFSQVFTWTAGSGATAYSDTPDRLIPAQSDVMNVRTHTLYRAKETETSKNSGSKNLPAEADSRQIKTDNCKAARTNYRFAESSQVHNRDELLQRYLTDIHQFCD